MPVTIAKCNIDDLHELQQISEETFYETYHAQNEPENMHTYMEQSFNLRQLEKELTNPASAFYFIYKDSELAGYLKLNTDAAQSDEMGEDALEVERIYIQSLFQRKGLGKHLLERAMDIAREQGKKKIWLGVWEHNANAIAFYKKMGFVPSGTLAFHMGEEERKDYIMVRKL